MNVDLRNGFEDWSLGGSFDDDPALYSLVKCSVYDIFFFWFIWGTAALGCALSTFQIFFDY